MKFRADRLLLLPLFASTVLFANSFTWSASDTITSFYAGGQNLSVGFPNCVVSGALNGPNGENGGTSYDECAYPGPPGSQNPPNTVTATASATAGFFSQNDNFTVNVTGSFQSGLGGEALESSQLAFCTTVCGQASSIVLFEHATLTLSWADSVTGGGAVESNVLAYLMAPDFTGALCPASHITNLLSFSGPASDEGSSPTCSVDFEIPIGTGAWALDALFDDRYGGGSLGPGTAAIDPDVQITDLYQTDAQGNPVPLYLSDGTLVQTTPEPGTLLLLLGALPALYFPRRYKRQHFHSGARSDSRHI